MPIRLENIWRRTEQRADEGDPIAGAELLRRKVLEARAAGRKSDEPTAVERQLARIIMPRLLRAVQRVTGDDAPPRGAGDDASNPQARRHLRERTKEQWLAEVAELSRRHGIKKGQDWDDMFATRDGFPSRKRVSAWLTELHGETVDGERRWPPGRGRQWRWMKEHL